MAEAIPVKQKVDDYEETIRTHRDDQQAAIYNAMPCIVVEDSNGVTLKVQPAIMGKRKQDDGTWKDVKLPEIHDVPVNFAGGGGLTLTHPIKKGDEVLVVFSSRPINTWWQSGDVQPALDRRMMHLSDAMAIPGWRSTPRALNPPPSTTAVELRNDKRTAFVSLDQPTSANAKANINVTTPDGSINMNAPADTIGLNAKAMATDVPTHTYKGTIIVTGEIVLNGVHLSTHRHDGVQIGGGFTTGPVD